MALETALGFAHRLIDVASQEKKIKTISLRILDSVVVRARFRLNRRFINVFYNSQTGTTAYSLIRSERRIFGADNRILTRNVNLSPLKTSLRRLSRFKSRKTTPKGLKGYCFGDIEKHDEDGRAWSKRPPNGKVEKKNSVDEGL